VFGKKKGKIYYCYFILFFIFLSSEKSLEIGWRRWTEAAGGNELFGPKTGAL
jgi:hypothetical protein